jgi:hypothetical protein
MDSFALKLILTPTLVGTASLAGRRWGPAISGWLVALPLTSGPIILFLTLSQGPTFAQSAATGTLSGTISQALFCLAYGWLAIHFQWPLAVTASALTFAGATAMLQYLKLPAEILFFIVVLVILLVLYLMPRQIALSPVVRSLPAWDIPARMIITTAYVVGLTAIAPTIGPHLTGLVSPFPLYGMILAAFAHHLDGSRSAIKVLKGLLAGLVSCAGFFVVLAVLIERVHVAPVFALAITVALVLQSGSLWLLNHFQQ